MEKAILLLVGVAVLAVVVQCVIFGPREILRTVFAPIDRLFVQPFVLNVKPVSKAVLVIAPVSKTNGATASASFDTLGFDYASIDVAIPTADTTTDGVSVLKVSESDDTTTTVTDVVALVGGTATSATVGFVLPAGKTSGNTLVKMNIDLKKRKRYLTLTCSPRTTQLLTAFANLSLAEQDPVSAANAGVDTLVNA